MTRRLIMIGALTCLCVALSSIAVFATAFVQPDYPPSPTSGPIGTSVTWTFETPLPNGSGGFTPGEPGDILFCTQEIDVGDFTIEEVGQLGFNVQQRYPTETVTFNVPTQAPPGSCTVRARGRSSGFEVTTEFEVTAIPYTGGPAKKTLPSWIAYLAGGIMLAVGGAFVWRRTRAA